jgi:hypothetical protein
LAQQLLDKSNQGPWPEKSTLQRRIIRDFENRMEIFDEIRQSVEKRFQASDSDNDDYGNRIKTELQSIIDDPEGL